MIKFTFNFALSKPGLVVIFTRLTSSRIRAIRIIGLTIEIAVIEFVQNSLHIRHTI